MTVQPGHPDWQAYATWRGPIPHVGLVGITNASPNVTDLVTTNYESVYLNVGPLTSGVSVAMGFYQDSTKANLLTLKAWVIRGPSSLNVITPALGNFTEVNVNTAQAGTINTQVIVAPMNVPVTCDTYPDSGNTIEQPTGVLVASQVVDDFFPFVSEGEGMLFFSPTDALGKINVDVYEVNEAGAISGKIYESVGAIASVGPVLFKTGRKQCKVTLTNTDAGGAHGYSIWAALIGRS